MNDNAFDEALRRVAADKSLPYADEAWRRMTARLDAHSSEKKARGLVLPLPMMKWAAAAAVVLVALVGAWFLGRESSKEAARIAVTTPKSETATRPAGGVAVPSEEATKPTVVAPSTTVSAARNSGRKNTSIAPSNSSQTPLPPPLPSLPQGPAVAASTSEEDKKQSAVEILPESQPVVIRKSTPRPSFQRIDEDFEQEPLLASNRTGFDINGGYGGGAGAKNNFAVGVAVKRSLNPRLQLEAGLGVVSGEYSTTNTVTVTTASTPGAGSNIGPSTSPVINTTTESRDVTERIAYLQATPTLSYKVAGGLALGGGVDAQRRISGLYSLAKSDDEVSFAGTDQNSFATEEEGPRPDWDFGLTARADYHISKRLRLGVMYRESISTTSTTGKKAAGRNYMLVQLGFRLF